MDTLSSRDGKPTTFQTLTVRQPRIFMYHVTTDLADDPNKLSVSPQQFEAQMLYLKRRNLRGVSIRELLRAMSAGDARDLVGLTFDDGYTDFLHTTVPILESFGFTATVFAVAGMLGKENSWKHAFYPRPRMELLDATGLREVSERGMEVGSHSMTHADLSGLDPRMLAEEVKGSRRVLSELLGEEVEGFCYPYGSVDRAASEATRHAGYAYACGWRTPLEYGYGAYNLPRIYIAEKDNRMRLAVKLRVYSQYSAITRRFRRR
jgi:peptidoglycan/xylan/chitin deacetylase (PgdA/CDA1 family)